MINIEKFKVGKNLKLSKIDTDDIIPTLKTKLERQAWLRASSVELDELQDKFYALKDKKLLIILQGMDTSGKDGTIRSVFHEIDLLGIHTHAFKAPNELELAHDYLWRVHQNVPAKGDIHIFNRSHYEDVLVTYVKKWIDKDEMERRLEHIKHFERMLSETGTIIIKFFLHISKNEQKERLQKRLDNEKKHWKFQISDLEDRKLWDDFQNQYEYVMQETSMNYAPWYVIPANSKSNRNVYVMEILLQHLRQLDLKYPTVDISGWPKQVE